MAEVDERVSPRTVLAALEHATREGHFRPDVSASWCDGCARLISGVGAPDLEPADGDVQRRCWTVYVTAGGNGQCRLFNGHDGHCLFEPEVDGA